MKPSTVTTPERPGGAPVGPLRILWVASKLELSGGVGRVLGGASAALAARGHEVHLAGPVEVDAPAPPAGVTLHAWPATHRKLRGLPALLRLQRELRAHVVHFHSALPHGEWIAPLRALRSRLGHPRIFVTPHTAARADFPKLRARLGLRAADGVLTPSRWSARRAVAAGADAGTTLHVYAGIELPEPARPERREPLVLALGRLRKVKGFDLLIDAFARAGETRPDWRLAIAGEGEELDRLRAQAAASRCAGRVELPGFVRGEAKRAFLERGSIGAVPSHAESFGGVLLELQAQGLPCVASETGGLAELSDSGTAALCVPPGDVEALAAALASLMDSPERRAELGRAARAHAEQLSWPSVAAEYERIYRTL